MTAEPWHLSTAVWQRYAAGELDAVAEASVETHLTSCAVCRSSASETIASAEVAILWEGVATAIARPRPTRLGRVATRVGLPDDDAVVVRASTALYLPWVISVSAALVCAALAAVLPEPHGTSSFVVIAPLIPVLAVAAAYDTTDPLRELVGPTPLSKLRIALLRASVALAAAVPVTLGGRTPPPGPRRTRLRVAAPVTRTHAGVAAVADPADRTDRRGHGRGGLGRRSPCHHR